MATDSDVTGHYSSGDLMDRLLTALADDGADPDRPTIADLAPHDQFHGRGLEATEDAPGACPYRRPITFLMLAAESAAGPGIWPTGSAAGSPAST